MGLVVRVLITGAAGFVGRAATAAFRSRGDAVLALVPPEASTAVRARLLSLGAELVELDLGDESALESAARDCDVALHAAERPPGHGTRAEYEHDNLVVTENALAACQRAGVRRFVFLSSESVTAGNYERRYVDESFPQPDHFVDVYSETKALAEDLVVGACGQAGMVTVVLRPGWLWGPDDNEWLPGLIRKRRDGSLTLIEGGRVLLPTTYVTNLTDAVIAAAVPAPGLRGAEGGLYYVTDDERVSCRSFFAKVLASIGLEGPRKSVPFAFAHALAWLKDRTSTSPRGWARREVIRLGRTSHFNVRRARVELGWAPAVQIDEGLRRLAEWAQRVGGADAIATGELLEVRAPSGN